MVTQAIPVAVTNKRAYTDYHYQIYYQHIKQSLSAKYLGVTTDQHLVWKNHINEICNKLKLIQPKLFEEEPLSLSNINQIKLLQITGKTNFGVCCNSLVTPTAIPN